MFLDGASNNTNSYVIQRTGSSYQNNNALMPSGNFIIGWDGVPASEVSSAKLAIVSTSKGFLPPKMTGTQQAGITSPVSGLIIYNTDSAALCYYNGSAWVKLGSGGSGGSGWSLTGNAGTNSATNFIGTTDNVPFYVRVNNDTVAKFKTNFNFSLGFSTNATGGYSTSTGYTTTASGSLSNSAGYNTTASGTVSTAMGQNSTASGSVSTAMGYGTTASGSISTSMGQNTVAAGSYSTALGNNTIANSSSSLAIGRANLGLGTPNDTTVLFEIGNGYNESIRSNIVTVKYDSIILNLPSKGNGKVLTSDANGNATWQTPSGGGSTDTSGFVHKSYNLTETITGAKTTSGSWLFNNTANGTANTTVTGGVQGVSDNVGLLINGTFAGATNAHSLKIAPTFSPTSNGFAIAIVDAPGGTGGTANHDHIVSYQSQLVHASSGTQTNAYGTYLDYVNNGGVTTNRYGHYARNASGSGTVTNQYMYYAEDPTKGSTTNYAFFAAGAGKLALTTGTAELGGSAIIGFGTGTAPGGVLEVRKNGANSLRLRNNGNWFQWTQPSGSADISFGSISGNNMKIYDGGNKTFFAPAQDSASNSGLWVNHSFATAYVAKTGNYTLNNNDETVNFDCTGGSLTATFPTAVGCKGRIQEVRKSDNSSNTLTLAGNSGQTFNGLTNIILSKQGDYVGVKSDGANWIVQYYNVSNETISTVSTYANYTTTATYQNIASITLAPGDWDLSAFYTYSVNSATLTAGSNAIFVLSTTTASASGATEGKNIAYVPQNSLAATSFLSGSIAPYLVSPTTSTTYYLNTQSTFTGGNPQYTGTIRARRIK